MDGINNQTEKIEQKVIRKCPRCQTELEIEGEEQIAYICKICGSFWC